MCSLSVLIVVDLSKMHRRPVCQQDHPTYQAGQCLKVPDHTPCFKYLAFFLRQTTIQRDTEKRINIYFI